MSQIQQLLANKKVVINLLILVALAIGLTIALQLIRQNQDLRSRADNAHITLEGANFVASPSPILYPTTGTDGQPLYEVNVRLNAPSPVSASTN